MEEISLLFQKLIMEFAEALDGNLRENIFLTDYRLENKIIKALKNYQAAKSIQHNKISEILTEL